MYCPKCGFDRTKNERECPRCGYEFGAARPSGIGIVPIIIGAAVVLVLIVVIVLIVRKNSANDNPTRDGDTSPSSTVASEPGNAPETDSQQETSGLETPPLFVPPIASFEDIQVTQDDQEIAVTVPKALAGDSVSEQLSETDISNGVVSRSVNDDSVTTIYLASDRETVLNLYLTLVAEGLFRLQELHSSIGQVQFDYEFKKIELLVDRENFLKLGDNNALVNAGLYGALYQLVSGTPRDQVSVSVLAKDQTTLETVDSTEYPK